MDTNEPIRYGGHTGVCDSLFGGSRCTCDKGRPQIEMPEPKAWWDTFPHQNMMLLARDIYQLHIDTGISLDKWTSARDFVEFYYGKIENNNV